MNSQTLLIVFIALTSLAMVVQAVLLVVICLAAKKAIEKLRDDFKELRETAVPFFKGTREVLTRIAPKIEPVTEDIVNAAASMRAISADVAVITSKVRTQVEGAQASTTEAIEKFRVQTNRVDTMVTKTLDSADRFGAFLQTSLVVPVKQLAGILAAAKAVMNSLGNRPPAAKRAPAPNDNENFV